MRASDTTYIGPEITDREILERLPSGLREVLINSNGFILFEGGLHIRGACYEPAWHSLREVWLGKNPLHRLFSALQPSDVPFGEDCVGDQFILRDDKVMRLDSETGVMESLDVGIDVFLQKAERNPLEYLGLYPLMQFQKDGSKLKPGELLNVYPPFCTKESGNGVSLKAVPTFERIRFLSEFAKKIGDVKDQQSIRIRTAE